MAAHGGGIDLSQIRNQQAQQQQAEMGIRLAMASCAASIAGPIIATEMAMAAQKARDEASAVGGNDDQVEFNVNMGRAVEISIAAAGGIMQQIGLVRTEKKPD